MRPLNIVVNRDVRAGDSVEDLSTKVGVEMAKTEASI